MLPTLEHITTKSFRSAQGGAEHLIAVAAPSGWSFERQMALLQDRYAEALRALRLSPETAIFRRLFLSDAMNQSAMLAESDLVTSSADNPVAVSVVQQPPLPDAKIALLAYHAEHQGHLVKRRISPKHLLVEKNGIRHLWSTGLCTNAISRSLASVQTRMAFDNLMETLSGLGANLRDHCVRTWIFLKDVDVFYQDMVDSRRKVFAHEGLTNATHYIASTGIEGACGQRFDVVALDAYSNLDVLPVQRSFLHDRDLMCAAHDYGPTFERGTRISYADRSHYFISGTASIDDTGRTVYPGNVVRQLGRALRNVEALLRSGGAHLHDMMYWTVYLRDATDHACVRDHMRERFPDVPMLIVQGAVCRPEWLVEVEGMAIVANDEAHLPAF